jgi:hypothetical protein
MNMPLPAGIFAKPSWPPAETIIIDQRGLPVDISGERWPLNEPMSKISLDWSACPIQNQGLSNSFRRYFAWLITTQAPISVRNAFQSLRFLTQAPAFIEAALTSSHIPYLAFSQARATLGKEQQWQLHHVRKLYRWCVSQGYPGFSRDVSRRLDDVVIGGNRKGQSVRSKDPDSGPLDAQEVDALSSALRAARVEGSMPLDEQAILWLALSLGSNAGQFASLREEDHRKEKLGEEVVAYILRVPRHKKGHVQHRAEFKKRRLTRFVGSILQDLIAQNEVTHPAAVNDVAARPLFRSLKPSFGHNDPLPNGCGTRLVMRSPSLSSEQ